MSTVKCVQRRMERENKHQVSTSDAKVNRINTTKTIAKIKLLLQFAHNKPVTNKYLLSYKQILIFCHVLTDSQTF